MCEGNSASTPLHVVLLSGNRSQSGGQVAVLQGFFERSDSAPSEARPH